MKSADVLLDDKILDRLRGGDLRSIGDANDVAASALRQPAMVAELIEALRLDDPIIRMRAADALEKVSAVRPEYLRPFKDFLLNEVSQIGQQEVRWHFAQICPRLELSRSEANKVSSQLLDWIRGPEKSRIVKTMALQALAELSMKNQALRTRTLEVLRAVVKTGSPAMKARAKKLLKEIGGDQYEA